MSDQHEPRTLIKSREVLQSLRNKYEIRKYQAFDRLQQMIWDGVKCNAEAGKTKYVFNLANKYWNQAIQTFPQLINSDNMRLFISDFMDILKKEYIDCKIEYVEHKGYYDKFGDQLIVIDWA